MNTIDINQLTKYLLLKDIEIEDVKKIQENIILTNYKKNDIIIKENDVGESILFLIDGDITISQALSDNNEKVRSLAAVRRAREKAKLRNLNNIENQETSESRERKKRDIIIPDFITVYELALRMAEKSSTLIKSLMKLGVMTTINETIDQLVEDTYEKMSKVYKELTASIK